ncbi:DUF72 domain-containing protein [Paenibacillus sp. M1]|uniref:DUF72 domain-containing protein n=1 Tax=Paenibacillus haidiansis TaxID=1574488 RepID=A0ABU7VXT9_9BACL
MITVGLSGWGDHPELYPEGTPANRKLALYAKHFPVVEVDSSFYAVLGTDTYRRWLAETPPDFSFILKAYRGMTGHNRGKSPFGGPGEMFRAYLDSVAPVVEAGRLKAIMFQFPPWFDCNAGNVRRLRAIRKWMGSLPLALEFRNRSWYAEEVRDNTLSFMKEEGWIHIICDEPQVGQGSVPTVLEPTDPEFTIVRLHGRNEQGWLQGGAPNWREIRTLYRYNGEELLEWKDKLTELESKGTKEVCMIFNNNSGGDAAANALELMRLLGMKTIGLPPKQIDLFGEGE